MNVDEVEPSLETGALLAGAQFSDAFRVAVDGNALNARTAAEIMFARDRDGARRCSPCAI